ncbi:hypothetical protein FA95DRAFT_658796 [Auriscalpium vulgare]|uniref:Uncharacterized protein n=1 Tax=Auriscalpium vulgare TaxID=40419 RepID=A0ACB8S2S0_9AGAM|nr:hypothetical protein FA95DRAFT_658796 [Auriscalpium vulgare]
MIILALVSTRLGMTSPTVARAPPLRISRWLEAPREWLGTRLVLGLLWACFPTLARTSCFLGLNFAMGACLAGSSSICTALICATTQETEAAHDGRTVFRARSATEIGTLLPAAVKASLAGSGYPSW